MRLSKLSMVVAVAAMSTQMTAQLTVQAEFRPRMEYRHGFKTLMPEGEDAALFVSQRTRLNTKYVQNDVTTYISFQDIRTWGDVSQMNLSDNNAWAVHEAWSQFPLADNVYAKLGRQELVYDDSRFLGNVAWAQQARSHDVALLKYGKDNKSIHAGFAFNQNGEGLTSTLYTVPKNYKAMQFVWLNHKWDNASASVLFLNNGKQFADADFEETRYSQTIGSHVKYNVKDVKFAFNAYYQMGNDGANNELSAYLFSMDAKYNATSQLMLGFGGEMISGNDNGVITDGVNTAFTPFYGTNHKFNGYMDYFYVGNHGNNIGLIDLYGSVAYKFEGYGALKADLHHFMSEAAFASPTLGTEIDLVWSQSLAEGVGMKVGYSQLFKAEGMDLLKGATNTPVNNWGWVMITVKPSVLINK